MSTKKVVSGGFTLADLAQSGMVVGGKQHRPKSTRSKAKKGGVDEVAIQIDPIHEVDEEDPAKRVPIPGPAELPPNEGGKPRRARSSRSKPKKGGEPAPFPQSETLTIGGLSDKAKTIHGGGAETLTIGGLYEAPKADDTIKLSGGGAHMGVADNAGGINDMGFAGAPNAEDQAALKFMMFGGKKPATRGRGRPKKGGAEYAAPADAIDIGGNASADGSIGFMSVGGKRGGAPKALRQHAGDLSGLNRLLSKL
jgi:hypothetical protein